jgi:uncharacterized protein (TIGR02611 family)
MASERRRRPKLIERLEARRASHRHRHPLFRAAFGIAGALVTLAGVVMLVTPGPGLLVIIGGLAILSHEFEWAARALEKAKARAAMARDVALGRRDVRRRPPTTG